MDDGKEHADRPPAGGQQGRAARPPGGRAAGAKTDLALLTDGLSAEREQGITIDVAYRYFATEERKFIIGDAPGHEQYTRNMVTAASSADAAVVLVDATKLDWKNPSLALLPQTRRHSLLVHLLRVHSLVFAVNKLDAVEDPALAWKHIQGALQAFAQAAGHCRARHGAGVGLKGWNVVDAHAGWCGYNGPTLLQVLEELPNTPPTQRWPPPSRCSGSRSSRPRPTPARAAACSGAAWLRAPSRPAPPCRSSPAASWPPWPRCWTTPAAPRTCPQAPAPASSSTARWMSRAATGFWLRPRRRSARC